MTGLFKVFPVVRRHMKAGPYSAASRKVVADISLASGGLSRKGTSKELRSGIDFKLLLYSSGPSLIRPTAPHAPTKSGCRHLTRRPADYPAWGLLSSRAPE